MRAFVRNYIQAEKIRREESGEKGFSLIELIVVVVILGVLAAVAIPIFLNIQATAQQNAVDSVAANGAAQAAAALAQDQTVDLSNLVEAPITSVTAAAVPAADPMTLDNFCVTATDGTLTGTSGPGCP